MLRKTPPDTSIAPDYAKRAKPEADCLIPPPYDDEPTTSGFVLALDASATTETKITAETKIHHPTTPVPTPLTSEGDTVVDLTKATFPPSELASCFPNFYSFFRFPCKTDGNLGNLGTKHADGYSDDTKVMYDLSIATSRYKRANKDMSKTRLGALRFPGIPSSNVAHTMSGDEQLKGSGADRSGHIRVVLPSAVVSFDDCNGPLGNNLKFGIGTKYGALTQDDTEQVMQVSLLNPDGTINTELRAALTWLNELSVRASLDMFLSNDSPCLCKSTHINGFYPQKTPKEKMQFFLHYKGDRAECDRVLSLPLCGPMFIPFSCNAFIVPDIDFIIAEYCGEKDPKRTPPREITVEDASRPISLRNTNLFRKPFEVKEDMNVNVEPAHSFGENCAGFTKSTELEFESAARGWSYNPVVVYDARKDGLPTISLRAQMEKKQLKRGSLVILEVDIWPRPAGGSADHRTGLHFNWVSAAILRSVADLENRAKAKRPKFSAI
jgi:hypothetical protein